ncbi:hypothetical protein [Cohaesibacter gelatinilyticus]|uniref:Uncharacterized protein n=1 Tax=Cohaesibacter gelatinilyticus TaxID=372072 RepID=A0A285ND19_9HYPH|nr:hypothetical protein [Cohaesibacter gelatinilyticus]SNZ07382.1 hypothetical protein SAMN06265368_0901 [Cohaesibacter gelatinilyticus]
MKPFAFAYFFLLLLLASNTAIAKKIDILEIYNRFYLTQGVAQKCGMSDKALKKKFSRNFAIVKIRAQERVQQRRPDFSEQKVHASFRVMNRRLDKVVEALGCKSTEAEQLMKLFKFHANWDMRR